MNNLSKTTIIPYLFLFTALLSIYNLPAQVPAISVTATQYANFLNRVATTDEQHLYDEALGSDPYGACIVRTGTRGSYSYQVIAGRENLTITYVNESSAAAYCDWLKLTSLSFSSDLYLKSNRNGFQVIYPYNPQPQMLTDDLGLFPESADAIEIVTQILEGIIAVALGSHLDMRPEEYSLRTHESATSSEQIFTENSVANNARVRSMQKGLATDEIGEGDYHPPKRSRSNAIDDTFLPSDRLSRREAKDDHHPQIDKPTLALSKTTQELSIIRQKVNNLWPQFLRKLHAAKAAKEKWLESRSSEINFGKLVFLDIKARETAMDLKASYKDLTAAYSEHKQKIFQYKNLQKKYERYLESARKLCIPYFEVEDSQNTTDTEIEDDDGLN